MKIKHFQESVENIGENLGPDDDWAPTLFMEKGDRLAIAGLMTDLKNDHDKDIMAKFLTEVISQYKPDAVCFITTSWALRARDEGEGELMKAGLLQPSTSPNRIEVVCCYCFGVKGESDGEVIMMGEIKRSDEHPEIVKWDILNDVDSAVGRFPEAIRAGFNLPEGGST